MSDIKAKIMNASQIMETVKASISNTKSQIQEVNEQIRKEHQENMARFFTCGMLPMSIVFPISIKTEEDGAHTYCFVIRDGFSFETGNILPDGTKEIGRKNLYLKKGSLIMVAAIDAMFQVKRGTEIECRYTCVTSPAVGATPQDIAKYKELKAKYGVDKVELGGRIYAIVVSDMEEGKEPVINQVVWTPVKSTFDYASNIVRLGDFTRGMACRLNISSHIVNVEKNGLRSKKLKIPEHIEEIKISDVMNLSKLAPYVTEKGGLAEKVSEYRKKELKALREARL